MSASPSRFRRFIKGALVYLGITVVTLVILDVICIALNILPPTHNYGDPELGWRSAYPTGKMAIGKCTEFMTGQVITYSRNEDGVRTTLSRDAITQDTSHVRIGVTGDSQTDLCATNEELHAGVLERELNHDSIPAEVFTFGSGRYSPLQGYLAFRKVVKPYKPQVFVLNVYTGNDLYDILRADDRPHFVATDSGYQIEAPIWYTLDDPAIQRKSRVLWALRTLGDKIGVRGILLRVSELRRLGNQQGAGMGTVISYMQDLLKAREPSVGYSDAFTAQMLNQQIFFRHFPGSAEESIRRMKALLELIRKENPGMILVLSPIPSYELVGEQPVDSALTRTLSRLPITYADGQQQERMLYDQLKSLAQEEQWVFVDNLTALHGYHGKERLYNNFDYHLVPIASELVGKAQSQALAPVLKATPRPWP